MNLTLNQFPVLVGFGCCSPYRKVKKTQHNIISPRLVSSFLCTSCRSLVSVCVVLSVCRQYRVVTGCTEAPLPPSTSILLPPSFQFDTSAPTFCRSASGSVPVLLLHLPPVDLMLSRCDRSHVNLRVSPLSSSPGSCSLPSSSQLCWKCKCVYGSSGGVERRYLGTQDLRRCCRISSPLHVASSASQIPQLLRKFEKVRTLWILKGE